jgi:hypothetical protein
LKGQNFLFWCAFALRFNVPPYTPCMYVFIP